LSALLRLPIGLSALLRLTIGLSVLLFTVSDYPFHILKLFLLGGYPDYI